MTSAGIIEIMYLLSTPFAMLLDFCWAAPSLLIYSYLPRNIFWYNVANFFSIKTNIDWNPCSLLHAGRCLQHSTDILIIFFFSGHHFQTRWSRKAGNWIVCCFTANHYECIKINAHPSCELDALPTCYVCHMSRMTNCVQKVTQHFHSIGDKIVAVANGGEARNGETS